MARGGTSRCPVVYHRRMGLLRFAPQPAQASHRGTTPLELLFDLAAVVAIGAAARGLALGIADGNGGAATVAFLCSFFMVWWAWMNFTWFASAYDDDSAAFRFLTMAMMFGALMLAAGVEAVFAGKPIWLALFGFVVMRLALTLLWCGAARGDPAHRATALRYAGGIAGMQVYWIGLVATVAPASAGYLPLFVLGAAGELAVPAVAERRSATPWHRQHIVTRYGRLNLIVLGQAFLAVVAAIELAPGAALPDPARLGLALGFSVIAFAMWSLYFPADGHLARSGLRHALLWGYGHFAVFGSAAAAGAGMQAMLMAGADDTRPATLTIAVAAAVYCAMLWLIRDRVWLAGARRWTLPAAALLLVMATVAAPAALLPVALVLAGAAVAARRNHTSGT